MIVAAEGLTKRYGDVVAVDRLSFRLEPGHITGFLGPNGSGKSTTMRLMLGLDHGEGRTTFDGRALREHRRVSTVVGAHLDAKFFHPRRTARAHLHMLAAESGVDKARVSEVLGLVGLESVADKRPGGFSLGMGQRLGLASAILARPAVLLLDEPANGLDPQSIQWLRDFLSYYAAQGNAVMVSSHLLSEMELMAHHLVVIARGHLIADEPMSAFVARSTKNDVLVRCADPVALRSALAAAGLPAQPVGADGLAVAGSDTEQVGALAFAAGLPLRELVRRQASLEDAFLELTRGEQDFATGASSMPRERGAR